MNQALYGARGQIAFLPYLPLAFIILHWWQNWTGQGDTLFLCCKCLHHGHSLILLLITWKENLGICCNTLISKDWVIVNLRMQRLIFGNLIYQPLTHCQAPSSSWVSMLNSPVIFLWMQRHKAWVLIETKVLKWIVHILVQESSNT